ncbi:MAG: DUF4388 domain-containing protein [Candidatus Sericytochromatia bacterium]|nr:DUF4388 domain-containing protein [Candidatus Sericytochromatia bacterium]
MLKEGSLQDFNLPDLVQILVLGRATGTLNLHSEGRSGRLMLQGGQLVAADLEGRQGEDAAADLFLWTTGVFDFDPSVQRPAGDAPLSLDDVTRTGLKRLERARELYEALPDFFSSRTWVHPAQLYQSSPEPLLALVGSGGSYEDLRRRYAGSELALLEEVTRLYQADQLGLSCAPEEQLRLLFAHVATALFAQFASISGVKMVEGLEHRLNEVARSAALGLRWRGGRLQDSLPAGLSKEQLLAAYRPQVAGLADYIGKVYGPAFVQRVVEPLLEEANPAQRALWNELAAPTPATQG